MGAWIEITTSPLTLLEYGVAPLVGAWIEIFNTDFYHYLTRVAPLVGAWIEMAKITRKQLNR